VTRAAAFALAAAAVAGDQATKLAADRFLLDRGPVTVIPGVLDLVHSLNRGGLFGLFADWPGPWRAALLAGAPLLAIAVLGWSLARAEDQDPSARAGLALVLGGATGNLLDRVARGEVVDFLDVYVSHPAVAEWLQARFGTAHWPTFNLADAAIVAGAGLLLLDLARASRPAPETAY
jgi:signal peptidase II